MGCKHHRLKLAVLALVTVTGAMLGWRTIRRPPRRRAPFLAILSIFTLHLGLWGWLEDWFNKVKHIGQDIKDFVHDAIQSVVGMLQDGLDRISGWAADFAGAVWRTFDAVYRTIENHVQRVYDNVRGWVNEIYGTVRGWVQSIYDWAGGAIRSAIDGVRGWVDDLWSWARGFARWVDDNVLQPLWQGIQDAYHFVRDEVIPFLRRLINDVADFARKGIEWLIDRVKDVFSWIDRFGNAMWQLIQKVWDWLLFLATHPFDWFHRLLDDFMDRAPRVFVGMFVRAIEKEGSGVERMLARFLGG